MDSTATVKGPTIAQIVNKFTELHAKYYSAKGYMISTIPDSIAEKFINSNPDSIWNQEYNQYASDKVPILCAHVVIELFGREFKLRFDRPYKSEHRCEFESYFGFGGHCKGYTNKRIIACFPCCCKPDDSEHDAVNELDAVELLTAAAAESTIDDAYVKRVIVLLVLGGYVKQWDAYYEFSEWFASFDAFPTANVRDKDIILSYMFEHMVSIVDRDTTTDTD